MLLSLAIAIAFSFLAVLRSGVLASRVKELEAERDALLSQLAAKGRRAESPSPIPALPAEPPLDPVPPANLPDSAPASSETIRSSGDAPLESSSDDWESDVGIRGAAWVAGIALLLSAVFFARWAIDQGWVRPGPGFGLMLSTGAFALVGAEWAWRRRLARVVSPLAAAGVAILYIAVLAAHSRYDLLSLAVAFASLLGVTVASGLLALRYQALAPAILSLLAGFGAAFALLSGQDFPANVFAYALLLNGGVVAMVRKKAAWFFLLWPTLFLTLTLQVRWFWTFMSPGAMLTGISVALAFGLFYLALPIMTGGRARQTSLRLSAIGGLAPLGFAFSLATSARYVDQWPLLFAMVAAVNTAVLLVTVLFRRSGLLAGAAIATSITLGWWALQGLKVDRHTSLLGSTLFAILLVSIPGLARRVARKVGRLEEAGLRVLEGAALVAGGGLFLFGLVMVWYDRGAPVGPFLMLATALGLLLVEIASHQGRLAGALALCTAGLVVLTQVWFFSAVNANTLIFYLAGPLVVSFLLSFLARRKARDVVDLEAEIAVQMSGWISILGLFLTFVETEATSSGWPSFLALASTGWPLFLAMLLQTVMITGSIRRTNWTVGLPVLLGATASYCYLWERLYLSSDQRGVVFGFTSLLYLGFLLLPFTVPFARWKNTLWPWLASAMSGVAFFFPLRLLYLEGWGDSGIGILPAALALLVSLTFRAVSLRFDADSAQGDDSRARVRHLTLFSVVAFWLLALAVQVQLERQWVTIAWALLALGLCGLYSRLGHPALAVFAGILYALVGARLLFNPAVLGYAERGLPLFNWILYTYGIPIAACWSGQALLRRASGHRWIRRLAGATALLGLLLGFWLINLEILDVCSKGTHITLDDEFGYGAKFAFSVGWGVYAVGLLLAGVLRHLKLLRYLSLAFLLLTVAKVFLYDLAALGGIFRPLSFLGLAAGLALVSFFYQRFVFRKS